MCGDCSFAFYTEEQFYGISVGSTVVIGLHAPSQPANKFPIDLPHETTSETSSEFLGTVFIGFCILLNLFGLLGPLIRAKFTKMRKNDLIDTAQRSVKLDFLRTGRSFGSRRS
jgi:hypothetical protein